MYQLPSVFMSFSMSPSLVRPSKACVFRIQFKFRPVVTCSMESRS